MIHLEVWTAIFNSEIVPYISFIFFVALDSFSILVVACFREQFSLSENLRKELLPMFNISFESFFIRTYFK